VLADGGGYVRLRALGAAARPAADVLARRLPVKDLPGRAPAAEALIAADPSRAPEAVGVLIEMAEARAAEPNLSGDPAYVALGRLDRAARPAAKQVAEALARHRDDALTAVLSRALRRVDPDAARAAGVR
jgi:hypothetical protein